MKNVISAKDIEDWARLAGLESLLWTSRQCEAAEKRLKLVSLDEHCEKILEVTRLSSHFECHADVAAAMKN